MGANGRDGVGMHWMVLTPGCSGAFQCGTRHVGSDALSALIPTTVDDAALLKAVLGVVLPSVVIHNPKSKTKNGIKPLPAGLSSHLRER